MKQQEKVFLFVIILIAFILRIYHLSFQSLWLDELHTMVEADPELKVSELFDYLRCCDQHPPLFFFLERGLFILFGHTDFVARVLCALAGTLSVWTIFLLGKEISSTKLGITAAGLTAINYFTILYSQEARNYILAFLFTTLSFLYFIRLIKQLNKKQVFLYVLFTLCLLYTHYYGLLVFAAQGVMGAITWYTASENKAKLFKLLALSFILTGIFFLPWLPFILAMSGIKSFWLLPPDSSFANDYFFEYFGANALLTPFLVFFLLVFFLRIIRERDSLHPSKIHYAFVLLVVWIAFTYLVPYVRSVTVVPMLHSRYTIVTLPAIILFLSLGITSIPSSIARNTLVCLFVLASFIDLLFVKDYYTRITKTQFREMTDYFVNHNPGKAPLIAYKTSWHNQYYMKLRGVSASLFNGDQPEEWDAVLSAGKQTGFWVSNAHNAGELDDEIRQKLEKGYFMSSQVDFFDAWLRLYLPIEESKNQVAVAFDSSQYFTIDQERVVALWGGTIYAKPVQLKPGRYTLRLSARGTPANGKFPEVAITANNKQVGLVKSTAQPATSEFTFEATHSPVTLSFEMTNDLADPEKKEDRNFFLYAVSVREAR
jgi:mannosyltransferase